MLIAYLGALRGILADYDKNAVLTAQLRSSHAPAEDALFEMQGVLEEMEWLDDEEDVALAKASAATDQVWSSQRPHPKWTKTFLSKN